MQFLYENWPIDVYQNKVFRLVYERTEFGSIGL